MKTIVCPTDFSAHAEAGIQYAHMLAVCTQARLVLLHAYYFPQLIAYEGASLPETLYREEETSSRQRLEEVCQRLKEQTPHANVSYATEVTYNTPIEAITTVARQEQADLIVMGTAGAHGIQELLLSSTAAEVIESAHCPVLVVPEGTPLKPLRKIVLATDLKGQLPAEAGMAVELASLFDAEIVFLHVLVEDNLEDRSQAREGFNRIYKKFAYDNVSFYFNHYDHVEEGIERFAHERSADLLIMVNHPRTFWQLLFKRSHTKHLAYSVKMPLLAIHA